MESKLLHYFLRPSISRALPHHFALLHHHRLVLSIPSAWVTIACAFAMWPLFVVKPPNSSTECCADLGGAKCLKGGPTSHGFTD